MNDWEMAWFSCLAGLFAFPILAFAGWVAALVWKDNGDDGEGL